MIDTRFKSRIVWNGVNIDEINSFLSKRKSARFSNFSVTETIEKNLLVFYSYFTKHGNREEDCFSIELNSHIPSI